MRYTRRSVQNVRAYRIGSRKPYPHWLRKAIATGYICIERGLGGITDAATILWNGKKQYFYEEDYLVKLPEGPIIGVKEEKFNLLYAPQFTQAYMIDKQLEEMAKGYHA